MCATIGQLKMQLERALRENNMDTIPELMSRIQRLEKMNPRNLRINLFEKAAILKQSSDLPEPVMAQFAWMDKNKQGKPHLVYNSRIEGFSNKNNDPGYDGFLGIFKNPYVENELIKSRCLIPVDFFVEQPESKNDNRKFLIRKEDQSPIWLAGICKQLESKEGEKTYHFSLITTAYSKITIQAHHHRSPLYLPDELIMDFLDPHAGEQQLKTFFQPPDAEGFIAYEIDKAISARKNIPYPNDDPRYIEPIGEVLKPVA